MEYIFDEKQWFILFTSGWWSHEYKSLPTVEKCFAALEIDTFYGYSCRPRSSSGCRRHSGLVNSSPLPPIDKVRRARKVVSQFWIDFIKFLAILYFDIARNLSLTISNWVWLKYWSKLVFGEFIYLDTWRKDRYIRDSDILVSSSWVRHAEL